MPDERDKPRIVLTDAADIPPAKINFLSRYGAWLRKNGVAVTAALISLLSGGISGWQAHLSSRSAQQSKDQFIQTQRRVIELEDIKLDALVLTTQGQLAYIVNLNVDNKGNSPALNAQLLTYVRVDKGSVIYPLKELHDTCVSLDKLGPVVGIIAPQNTKTPMSRQPSESSAPLLAAIDSTKPDAAGNQSVTTRLAVCVRYDDRFTNSPHHEGELYDLAVNIPADVYAMLKANQNVVLKGPDSPSYFHAFQILNGFSD